MISMVDYAKNFIGTKYKWGGESPEEGYDCGGFIQELLASTGRDPKGDQTAQALYNELKETGSKSYNYAGSILFFGKDVDQITHVALAINDRQMIEAAGEGRVSTTKGMVRIRMIESRKDLVSAIYLGY